ncbi:hypothetical protein LSAT2_010153 [Lamellibrachia satsuma]|nr:hypothetical protein LSAT2_010153 [Lamellibrachia satsuma]
MLRCEPVLRTNPTTLGLGRYPHNNLQCPVLKEALTRELVTPVIRLGDQTFAFRIVWRETSESLEAAWDAVALQRRKCDTLLRAQPNVEFFVSSITGVFTKSATRGLKPRAIFPAVSYWIVTNPNANDVNSDDIQWRISRQLHTVCTNAEFKPIKAQMQRFSEPAAYISASLFVVLKDHRSGYIRRRVDRSLHVLGDVSEARAPARVVVLHSSKYRERIMNAEQTLQGASLSADFLVVGDVHISS